MYKGFFKRIFDFFASLILLLITSPLFIILTIAGFFLYGGKPFFMQQRIGFREHIFTLIKFKTMKDRRDEHDNLLPDEMRLTRFGSLIRKTSFDELPQLLNVLIGNMSMIGPRPLLIKYLPWYTVAERRRHQVRSGITGLAQITGRNQLSWDERLRLDMQYVSKLSLMLDLSIAIKTIGHLFSGSGVSADPRSDMEDFDVERKNKRYYRIGDAILLRKPTREDAEQLLVIKNNSEASKLLVNPKSGYTIDDIHKWIHFHTKESSNDMFIIEDIANRHIIGHTALYDIDPINRSCTFGILIGDTTYWNKGIGRAVTTEMIDIAFHELMLQYIFLEVMESNSTAFNLYRSLRFEVIKEMPITNSTGQTDLLFTMRLEHDD